jgi:hypothetical protein
MAEKNIWDKFDNEIDVDGLAKDVEEAAENGDSYKEVPFDTYEVAIDKLELTTSKKGDPMLSVWFKILAGEFKNSRIFMNQVVTQGFQIHIANEFLRSLETGVMVEFKSYKQYANMIMDIFEAVEGNLEYALNYGEGKKGFATYEIEEVYEVE